MKIGLIQVDGTLPNLALMKLSAYHQAKGDQVFLMVDDTISSRLIDFDKVYVSCIFEDNKDKAIAIQKQFKNVELGGIGVNQEVLPHFIEHTKPDYETFSCDYSIGFSTRGCIRSCDFCKVPKQEGMIKANSDIYEFWNSDHKHIVLLDNNILAHPQQFKKISEQIIKENVSVDFNQGLDIRLVNDDNAKVLKKLRVKPCYRFAFDDPKIEPEIIKGIDILHKHGIKRSTFFVLVGYNTTEEEDLKRLNLLKELDQRVYVMRYKDCRGKRFYNDLSAWGNQPQFYMSMTFDRFRECRSNRMMVSK